MATEARHKEALGEATAALKEALGREPSACEVHYLMAVAQLETGYGYGWTIGKGSNNMGAITAGSSWKGDTFTHGDSRYQDGKVVSYETEFRRYPSRHKGWVDLARIMYVSRPSVLEAASACDSYGVSRELRETSYYLGVKPKPEAIADHHDRLTRMLSDRARKLGDTGGEKKNCR